VALREVMFTRAHERRRFALWCVFAARGSKMLKMA